MSVRIPLFNAFVGPLQPTNPVNGTIWIDTSGNTPVFKTFVNGSWVTPYLVVGQTNADTLQGFAPSHTSAPNTIPVRDNNGKLDPSSIPVLPSFTYNTTIVSSNTITLNQTHSIVFIDAGGGNRTVNLPDATTCTGREYVIKKIDSSNNTVTIVPAQGQSVDGKSDVVLHEQYEFVVLVSSGSTWFVIGR